MSNRKINQNMDFGDIIYYVLVVFFLILSFFNKSKKDKKAQKQMEQEDFPHPDSEEAETMPFPFPKNFRKKNTPPPIPDKIPQTNVRREFQSSLSLVTDFKKESSLEGSLFVNDEGMRAVFSGQKEDGKALPVHPLVADLLEKDSQEELKRAIIYSEIFQRKF